MKIAVLIAFILTVDVLGAFHGDAGKRDTQPTSVRIGTAPVTPETKVMRFNTATGRAELTPAGAEDAERINQRLDEAKSTLEKALEDPELRRRGLEEYLFIKDVEMIGTGFSQSGKTIVLNPMFKQTEDDLVATLIHEQLHSIIHSKQNHSTAEIVKAEIMKAFEKKVPGITERLNLGQVPGVNPRNLGCLPPKPVAQCTQEHMLVNWLEMRAMERLWGKEKSDKHFNEIINSHGVYAGIYEWLRKDENSKIVADALNKEVLEIPGIRQALAAQENETVQKVELADSRPPTHIEKLPRGAHKIQAKGWEKLGFKNEGSAPITIKIYFSVPQEGRSGIADESDIEFWREVRVDPKPGFVENPHPLPQDQYQITLAPGEFKGWNRRGGNPFALVIIDSEGNNISSDFAFKDSEADRFVSIKQKP